MNFEMHGMMVIKLLVGMAGVLFFLRMSGKSQMAQMTPTDIVNSFVIGAIVGGIIYDPDLSVWDMLFAMVIWSVINITVRLLSRNSYFSQLFQGKSEFIIKDGKLDLKVMERNNLSMEQLIARLREKDIYSLLDVDDIRFEADGQLTVFESQKEIFSYLLVNNGKMLKDTLKEAHRTEQWLHKELDKLGYSQISDLFCVEWTPDKGFYIIDKWGNIETLTIDSKLKELEGDISV
ncbi:DUF421 domain-containing protein [Bacteroides coprosuis]|uniref:DUF421 domain-containing protein n=1 Tax=Bacteroides coprosuis TaxID=151276 RepID=UPI001E158BBA|nr:YetF domain-containing protein [Bacteroides coprosuis]HJD91928.1 DUF421 domain-containing protein [Bacteroides coprosuis]